MNARGFPLDRRRVSWVGTLAGTLAAAILLGARATAAGGASDAELVAALLESRCVACHGPRKQKAGLRLDELEGLASVIAPGRVAESELFRRIALPIDAEDAMPPDDERVSDRELLAVLHWINAGAPTEAFERRWSQERASLDLAAGLLDEVGAKTGARITPLDGGTDGGVRVDFSLGDEPPGAERFAALAPVGPRVRELSFAGQRLDSSAVAVLPALPALERLHAERSTLDDQGLAQIVQGAPDLRYVNVHSTAVTAGSLDAVGTLARLERLVLLGTAIPAPQLAAFRASHPAIRVTGRATLPAEPFAPGRAPRRVLAADASAGRIALLQETALGHFELLWEHPIEAIHDLQLLPSGNVLFQETWTRLVEVDPRTDETVWSYDAARANRAPGDGAVEVHAFQRLEAGVTMIAESGPARIIEVDGAGKLLRTVPLDVDHPDPHHDTRLVRKTDAGTWLVAHEADGVVREYDPEGKVVWSFDVPLFGRAPAAGHQFEAWGDQVFAAVRLPGGNTLITTGNGHGLLEVSPAGEIVWQLTQDELEGIRLAWVTTVQVLANGNLVLGNCHAGEGEPQLVELDRDKRVVWTFHDFERFGNALSNAWVVEDSGRGPEEEGK